MVKPTRPDRLARRRAGTAWMLVAPMLTALAAVALWPLARTIWFSFTDATLFDLAAARFVGLDNFALLLADPEWWRSLWNTIVFTAASVVIEICLGFAIALVLHGERSRVGHMCVQHAAGARARLVDARMDVEGRALGLAFALDRAALIVDDDEVAGPELRPMETEGMQEEAVFRAR